MVLHACHAVLYRFYTGFNGFTRLYAKKQKLCSTTNNLQLMALPGLRLNRCSSPMAPSAWAEERAASQAADAEAPKERDASQAADAEAAKEPVRRRVD